VSCGTGATREDGSAAREGGQGRRRTAAGHAGRQHRPDPPAHPALAVCPPFMGFFELGGTIPVKYRRPLLSGDCISPQVSMSRASRVQRQLRRSASGTGGLWSVVWTGGVRENGRGCCSCQRWFLRCSPSWLRVGAARCGPSLRRRWPGSSRGGCRSGLRPRTGSSSCWRSLPSMRAVAVPQNSLSITRAGVRRPGEAFPGRSGAAGASHTPRPVVPTGGRHAL